MAYVALHTLVVGLDTVARSTPGL